MNKGFMLISRDKMADFEWLDNPVVFYVFVRLLLMANYQDKLWRGMLVQRGQLITGLSSLSNELNLSVKQIRTALDKLEKGRHIGRQKGNQFTVVTICEYDSWVCLGQAEGRQEDSPEDALRASEGQAKGNNLNKESNIKQEKEENNREANASMSSGDDAPKKPEFDYDKFMAFFNKTMEENGSVIPQIKKIETRRRRKIHARIEDYGENAVYEVVTKAAKSKFLNGGGNKGWTAHFDWLFGPDNFRKVLEGNYDNGTIRHGSNATNNGFLVGQLLTDSEEERDRKFKGTTGWR